MKVPWRIVPQQLCIPGHGLAFPSLIPLDYLEELMDCFIWHLLIILHPYCLGTGYHDKQTSMDYPFTEHRENTNIFYVFFQELFLNVLPTEIFVLGNRFYFCRAV